MGLVMSMCSAEHSGVAMVSPLCTPLVDASASSSALAASSPSAPPQSPVNLFAASLPLHKLHQDHLPPLKTSPSAMLTHHPHALLDALAQGTSAAASGVEATGNDASPDSFVGARSRCHYTHHHSHHHYRTHTHPLKSSFHAAHSKSTSSLASSSSTTTTTSASPSDVNTTASTSQPSPSSSLSTSSSTSTTSFHFSASSTSSPSPQSDTDGGSDSSSNSSSDCNSSADSSASCTRRASPTQPSPPFTASVPLAHHSHHHTVVAATGALLDVTSHGLVVPRSSVAPTAHLSSVPLVRTESDPLSSISAMVTHVTQPMRDRDVSRSLVLQHASSSQLSHHNEQLPSRHPHSTSSLTISQRYQHELPPHHAPAFDRTATSCSPQRDTPPAHHQRSHSTAHSTCGAHVQRESPRRPQSAAKDVAIDVKPVVGAGAGAGAVFSSSLFTTYSLQEFLHATAVPAPVLPAVPAQVARPLVHITSSSTPIPQVYAAATSAAMSAAAVPSAVHASSTHASAGTPGVKATGRTTNTATTAANAGVTTYRYSAQSSSVVQDNDDDFAEVEQAAADLFSSDDEEEDDVDSEDDVVVAGDKNAASRSTRSTRASTRRSRSIYQMPSISFAQLAEQERALAAKERVANANAYAAAATSTPESMEEGRAGRTPTMTTTAMPARKGSLVQLTSSLSSSFFAITSSLLRLSIGGSLSDSPPVQSLASPVSSDAADSSLSSYANTLTTNSPEEVSTFFTFTTRSFFGGSSAQAAAPSSKASCGVAANTAAATATATTTATATASKSSSGASSTTRPEIPPARPIALHDFAPAHCERTILFHMRRERGAVQPAPHSLLP